MTYICFVIATKQLYKPKTIMYTQEEKPDVDVLILQSLAAGLIQSEISEHFKKMGITPNSVSIIEKRINKMKKEYRANTLFHLALIVKRKGII